MWNTIFCLDLIFGENARIINKVCDNWITWYLPNVLTLSKVNTANPLAEESIYDGATEHDQHSVQ
jgi:hypothetical protein